MTPVQRILEFIGTKELSPLADYIRKEILPLEEKMLEECWEAASHRTAWEDNPIPPVPPDKETYISNVLNNKK